VKVQLHAVTAHHPAAKRGGARALTACTLQLAQGEQVAIIGPSGAGKTTLLHVMAAALQPEAGTVELGGQNPWGLGSRALRALRGRLFLAPQMPPLPPRQRVVSSVLAGQLPALSLWQSIRSLFYPHDIAGAHAALAHFDIESKLFDRVDRLSGGERQRVGLARAVPSPASLWLIDEPLSALDPTRAQQAISALTSLAAQRGITLVATLHQVDVALSRFKRIVGLRDGHLVFDLPAAQVTTAMLTSLYGDEFQRLNDPGTPSEWPPESPAPAVMHCR
jgi:phosphonate transport system ATP-binding protein